MNARRITAQRGFSLLESLVALAVVAFGLLALAGVNLKLAHSEDVARQRGEATRLAQEKIEQLRSFTQIKAGAGALAWDTLAGSTDTIADSASYHTNTAYTRTWQLLGTITDPMRRLQVTVNWTDRVGEPQSVSFATVIAKADPREIGSLGFPVPSNLKRPKDRSLNIPVPAIDLGNGESVVTLDLAPGVVLAVIFSNSSGWVVKTCNHTVTSAADLASGCTNANAYIVAGYLSLSGTSTFPTGPTINTGLLTGTSGTVCSVTQAKNQTTLAIIPNLKYYLCVVSVATQGAPWSGKVRLASPQLNAGTNYLVCRFQYLASQGGTANQRNVQSPGYVDVNDSLDNQNYVITTGGSCPTIDGLNTTLHQNCRNSNPSRAADCPAI